MVISPRVLSALRHSCFPYPYPKGASALRKTRPTLKINSDQLLEVHPGSSTGSGRTEGAAACFKSFLITPACFGNGTVEHHECGGLSGVIYGQHSVPNPSAAFHTLAKKVAEPSTAYSWCWYQLQSTSLAKATGGPSRRRPPGNDIVLWPLLSLFLGKNPESWQIHSLPLQTLWDYIGSLIIHETISNNSYPGSPARGEGTQRAEGLQIAPTSL